MIKNRNFKLMIVIIFFIVLFLGIGSIMLNSVVFKKNVEEDQYYSDEDISNPVVTNIGLPDGEVSIESDIVKTLFEYFREDRNCMYNYVNNINGSNQAKLAIAYNYLIDSKGVSTSCSNYSVLVIGNKYFCSDSIDINHDYYILGINSSEFINYLKTINTIELDGGLLDQEMNNIFGNGVGYIKQDFLFSNDSYIHYDNNLNKYVMYKYYNNNEACKNYDEVLISANSSSGVLEIVSKLMDGDSTIRNIKRVFKFNQNTGKYVFENRYLI